MTNSYRFAILAIHIVEFMFFAGLIGCATAVLFSWVSIVRDVVSPDEKA
jgi:hypothetical protein